ncbi:MAG TPA: SAM-dependent chlorinase/fluorinase [Methylomirabilota bacterium]|nr:SAM-dependent chlorinase/fluorinase [Methylomirabilota bacterium]
MLITLTTDFGSVDPFVGIIKGVIAGINPAAQVVDISHGVPPQDIMAAALILRHSVSYFPRGTIHVVVVDPGVGSDRRPLLIESSGNYFVGPDNGVLSLALDGKEPTQIIRLSHPRYHLQPTSATFHGRDIFAPVAAHLSLGIAPASFGEAVGDFVRLNCPEAVRSQGKIDGEILYIDSFGNLFTNIAELDLQVLAGHSLTISLGNLTVSGLASNYASAASDKLVAVINGWGLLELALYKGSAQRRTGAKIGDRVQIRIV